MSLSEMISLGARTKTGVLGNWVVSWETATLRVARAAATPRGASYSTELVALSAGVGPQREILSATSGLCRANYSLCVLGQPKYKHETY